MRARTLDPARPSIFDALGDKYTELSRPEPVERARPRGSRLAGVAVLLLVAAGAVLYFVDAARTPARREVGEISLFQPAASLPPGVEVPAPKPPRATKAPSAPPLPPVERPPQAEPVREKKAEPLPPPPAAPPQAPAVEAPSAASEDLPPTRPAEEPSALPEPPALPAETAAEEPAPAPEVPPPVPAEVEPLEPAVKLFAPPPSYPQADWVAAVEGDVSLQATIGADGRVAAVELIQGVSPGLDAAAVAALRRWRYRPATRGGEPVASVQRLTFRFRR